MKKIEDIVFGGIYKENNNLRFQLPRYYERLNDQKQHWWFPVRVVKEDGTDNIYMIDTYQFGVGYSDNLRKYDNFIIYLKSLGEAKDNSWLVYKTSDYYYSARLLLTDKNIDCFDLVANLEDYEPVSERDSRYYVEEDIIGYVKFWNYHNHGRGIILKRKDAKLRYDLKIKNLINDVEIKVPNIYQYDVVRVVECEKEAIKNNAEYDKQAVVYLLKLQKYINRIEKNYHNYVKKLKKELGENNE